MRIAQRKLYEADLTTRDVRRLTEALEQPDCDGFVILDSGKEIKVTNRLRGTEGIYFLIDTVNAPETKTKPR